MNNPLSVKQIIKNLELEGLIVDDYEELKYYIRNFNYNYVILPYKELFFDFTMNKFIDNSKSSQIINLYNFDIKISLKILSAILETEKKLNTNLAYMLIYEYNLEDKCLFKLPKEKLRFKVFTNIKEIYEDMSFGQFLVNLVRYCDINTNSMKYNDKSKTAPLKKWVNCPIDVMCLSWSFATTFKVFLAVNDDLRKRVMANFKITSEHLKGFCDIMKIILHIRNLISHNDILYNHNIIIQTPDVNKLYEYIFHEKIQQLGLLQLANVIDYFNDNRTSLNKILIDEIEKLKFNKESLIDILNLFNSKHN